MLWIEILIGRQVICDSGYELAKHIRHDGIKHHIANSKGILKVVLFIAFHQSEFVTVTGQFSRRIRISLGRNKATFLQTNTE